MNNIRDVTTEMFYDVAVKGVIVYSKFAKEIPDLSATQLQNIS